MNGLGYTPICSSSAAQKTYKKPLTGLLRPFLGE